jgi:hypothetical protein
MMMKLLSELPVMLIEPPVTGRASTFSTLVGMV